MNDKIVLNVRIRQKVASLVNDEEYIVCGNDNYAIKFDFDDDFAGYKLKTAVFVSQDDKVTEEVVFDGDTCNVPPIYNSTLMNVGVIADNVRTTTPAYVKCKLSISDIAGKITPPTEDVYNQIMALLNQYIENGVSEEQIKQYIYEYLQEYDEMVTEQELQLIISKIQEDIKANVDYIDEVSDWAAEEIESNIKPVLYKVEGQVDDLESEVSNTILQIESINRTLASVETDIDNVQEDIVDVEDRLSYLESLGGGNGDVTDVKIVQTTGDSETAVMSQKAATDNFANNQVINLFDKNAVTPNSLLNTASGNISSFSGFNISDFIEVEDGKTYCYMTSVSSMGEVMAKRLPIYNSNKEFIGFVNGTVSGNIITVFVTSEKIGITLTSADIKYARFNAGKDEIDITMFVEGEVYPNEYYEYGKRYLAENVHFRPYHLAQIPAKDSPLKGKKIAYNGDSICESRTNENSTSYNGGGYAKIISDLTGCTYENRAISGGILASRSADGTTVRRYICTDVANMASDADLICFEGGINDYWTKVPLGEFSENDFTGTLDDTTLTGALESIFRQAINKWVGKPICFVIVHKITTTAYTANSAGYTFKQAHDRIVQVCEKYSIPYFDAFASGGLNAYMSIHNQTYLTANSTGNPDGCHPNEEGYKKYYVPQLIKLFESLI